MTFHHRNVCTIYRKEATDEKVSAAVNISQDPGLPRRSIEFLQSEAHFSGRWTPAAGMGSSLETYIENLYMLDKSRRDAGGTRLTDEILCAFDAVVRSAAALDALGWPVN